MYIHVYVYMYVYIYIYIHITTRVLTSVRRRGCGVVLRGPGGIRTALGAPRRRAGGVSPPSVPLLLHVISLSFSCLCPGRGIG